MKNSDLIELVGKLKNKILSLENELKIIKELLENL